METDLTPEQSLKLIESMIGSAKRSFHRISFYFLLWGVILIGAMLSEYFAARAGSSLHGKAWGVAGLVGGIISAVRGAGLRVVLRGTFNDQLAIHLCDAFRLRDPRLSPETTRGWGSLRLIRSCTTNCGLRP